MAWLTGWKFRKKHDINGSSAGSVTYYQIRVVVHYGSGADGGEHVYLNSNCRTDFGDVRFTDLDGNLLDYWMERKVDGDYAIFWVEVPSIPASPDTVSIYVYYGKSDATYVGDGEATFIFFDDFSGTSLDSAKWDDDGWAGYYGISGYYTLESGELKVWGDGSNYRILVMKHVFDVGEAVVTRTRRESTSCSPHYSVFDGEETGSGYSNRVCVTDYGTDGDWDVSNRVAGTLEYVYDVATFAANTYYKVEIYRKSSDTYGIRIYDDDYGELYSGEWTKSSWNTTMRPNYWFKYNVNKYLDFVIIRKYVDPEPSHGTWYAAECVTEFSESVATSDVMVKSVSITRAESLSLSDVVSALRVKVKELVESMGLSDAVVKLASIVRSETITVSDVLEKVKTLYREFVETIGLTDRISKLISMIKSETLSLTDYLEKRFVILKILSETLGLSDTLARIRIKKTLARIKGVTRILSAIREKPAERELGR